MTLLSPLTLLSLEQATTLPFLTQRLARDGARVIRVETPGRGDPNRYVGKKFLPEDGLASYFLPNNCGKQAITLNLAAAEGRALLHELIAKLKVDIFATNNRASSYQKLGIDYETLKAIRPDLIWVGITGFGPELDEAAYDPVLQARAGWMELTGESDGSPLVFGLPMVDLGAAEHSYGAVMKALYQRAVSGAGAELHLSMFRSAVTWMISPLMLTALGEPVTRRGNTHQFFAPVSVYPTRDGYVYVAVGNDRQWEALTKLKGFESLAEEKYQRNAGRIAEVENLNRRLSACTREFATPELMAALNNGGIPVARVNPLTEVLADPLLKDSFRVVRDPHTATQIMLPPLPTVAQPEAELTFPPRLGEHNELILSEALGYTTAQVQALHARGII